MSDNLKGVVDTVRAGGKDLDTWLTELSRIVLSLVRPPSWDADARPPLPFDHLSSRVKDSRSLEAKFHNPKYKKYGFKAVAELPGTELLPYAHQHFINWQASNARSDAFNKFVSKLTHYISDVLALRIVTHTRNEADAIVTMLTSTGLLPSCNLELLVKEHFEWAGNLAAQGYASFIEATPLPHDVSHKESGYRSTHMLLRTSVGSKVVPPNIVFELQIRSVVEHAWASVEHELNYKSGQKLKSEFQVLSDALVGIEAAINRLDGERNKLVSARQRHRAVTSLYSYKPKGLKGVDDATFEYWYRYELYEGPLVDSRLEDAASELTDFYDHLVRQNKYHDVSKSVKTKLSFHVLSDIGYLRLRRGDWQQAAMAYEHLLKINQDDVTYYDAASRFFGAFRLSQAYFALRRYSDAENNVEDAVSLFEKHQKQVLAMYEANGLEADLRNWCVRVKQRKAYVEKRAAINLAFMEGLLKELGKAETYILRAFKGVKTASFGDDGETLTLKGGEAGSSEQSALARQLVRTLNNRIFIRSVIISSMEPDAKEERSLWAAIQRDILGVLRLDPHWDQHPVYCQTLSWVCFSMGLTKSRGRMDEDANLSAETRDYLMLLLGNEQVNFKDKGTWLQSAKLLLDKSERAMRDDKAAFRSFIGMKFWNLNQIYSSSDPWNDFEKLSELEH